MTEQLSFDQEKRAYGKAIVGYTEPLIELACEIEERFGEHPNHCIIVRYNYGKAIIIIIFR